MELISCDRCEKPFMRKSSQQVVCPKCTAIEEEEFSRVKEYLAKNSNANVERIAEDLDIPQKAVLRFLQSGRLEVAGARILTCYNCGKRIDRGTMCEMCQHMLLREIKSVTQAQRPAEPTTPSTSSRATGFHIKRKT